MKEEEVEEEKKGEEEGEEKEEEKKEELGYVQVGMKTVRASFASIEA